MSATDISFGISRVTGSLIDEVTSKDKTQVAKRRGSNGNTARVHVFDQTFEGSIKGGGTPTLASGIGSAGVSGISAGVTVITEVEQTEKADDFNSWTASFENFPNAQEVD